MSESKKTREQKIAEIYHRKVASRIGGLGIIPGGDEILAGTDDRKDYFDADAAMQKLADATVILTNKSELTQQADGSFALDVDPFQRGGRPPCSDERFANQQTGGWCSGFMVGSDIIVTAGHCGETEDDIQDTAYVFGFRVDSDGGTGITQFSADQVYFGKELIAHDLSHTGDFAIVRVDRPINTPNAALLQVRKTGSIGLGDNIGVIGYPSGLPVKIAFGDETVVMRHDDPWLIANLDTYGGNSGSAVFNEDGLVEGILVRGARDYVIDIGNGCFRSNRIANAVGSEAVTLASVFVDKIPNDEDEGAD